MATKKKTTNFRKLLREHEKLEYEATEENCRFWFNLLNEELFDGVLPPVPFGFKWLRKRWAYYEYDDDPEKAIFQLEKIVMHRKYPTKRMFVEVLAHEMVHHWQYKTLGGKKVDHEEEFVEWCIRAKTIGLNIK